LGEPSSVYYLLGHSENCAELFGIQEAESFRSVTHEAARMLGVPQPLC
jgi:hypothetical protein